MAESAGLSFDIQALHDHLNFQWSGFNDSMDAYVGESLRKIVSMKEEDLATFFDQAKENLLI